MITLPEAYETTLASLAAAAWRERKESVVVLRELVERDRSDVPRMTALAARLLDGLVSADALEGRAACHEVLVAIGAPAVPILLERLEQPGPSQRLLVDLLAEIGDSRHTDRLVAITRDPTADPNLRASATVALGALGGPQVAAPLVALLDDPSEMIRVHALEALRTARVAAPLEPLHAAIANPFTRKAAAAVLGRVRDPAAITLLVSLLQDEMTGVRTAAVRALRVLDAELGAGQGAVHGEDGHGSAVATALVAAGPDTHRELRALAIHRDREVRAAAIRMLGLAGDTASIPVLVEAMDDPVLAEEALAVVRRLGPAASPALVRASDDVGTAGREPLLRLVGAVVVPLDPPLLGVLVQALHDPSEDAAVAAAEAIARAGDRTCLPALYRALSSPGLRGDAAADAIVAIARRHAFEGFPEELEAVVGPVWPQDGDLARNLCRVVGQLAASRYAPHLVAMLGSPDTAVRVAAAVALGQLPGDHEGTSALSFALTDEEPHVRAAACRSLGILRVPGSLPSLVSATHDRTPHVRAAAVQALVALDNPVALARLRAIVAEDPVPTVVVQAIAGLGSSGLEQDLTMLMSLCTSADWEVVKAAARALVRYRAHRATAALLGLLGHERWDVRFAAAEVLAERGDRTALAPLGRAVAAESDPLVRERIAHAVARLEPTA